MAEKENDGKQETEMQLKISGLIAQISDAESGGNIEDARTQLLAIGSPAVPALLEAAHSQKGISRVEIARILSHMRDPATARALVELLTDDDFDVRWEAVEGLSNLGYDGLEPLLAALIQGPGSARLRNSAHHVLHHIAGEGYYALLKPLMMAIESSSPAVEVPAAARKVQSELARA